MDDLDESLGTVENGTEDRPTGAEPFAIVERPTPRAGSLICGERYRIVERLALGGMGEVLLARDEQVGREVVVKRMRASAPSPRAVERFLREARLQGRLDHPAVVPVHEIGVDGDGTPFFVMKRLTGTTLEHILKQGERSPFSTQRLLRAFADVCLAIERAHVQGIVHRDLKPANIMLGDYGEVHVLDWGVAKVTGHHDVDGVELARGSGLIDASTLVGTAIGTPGYMAPEQVRGETDVDARADVYALGCVLFEILAGSRLHPRGRDGMVSAVEGCDARPSRRAPERDIAPELDELCMKATAPRALRIRSARELGERVQRYLDGDRDLATRRALAGAHLDRARAAFDAGHSEREQRDAIQNAGRALALDPTLAGAAELVGRMMLEPPRLIPREVEDAVQLEDASATKENARVAAWAYLGFLALMPLLAWIAPEGTLHIPALAGLIAVCVGLCWGSTRRLSPLRTTLITACNAAIIVVVARMYTPLFVAPGLAALMTLMLVITPVHRRFHTAVMVPVLMIAATVGVWMLEPAGVLRETIAVTGDAILLRAAAVDGEHAPALAVAALYVAVLIGVSALFAIAIRRRERRLKRHLHLQAWQLRQLVGR